MVPVQVVAQSVAVIHQRIQTNSPVLVPQLTHQAVLVHHHQVWQRTQPPCMVASPRLVEAHCYRQKRWVQAPRSLVL